MDKTLSDKILLNKVLLVPDVKEFIKKYEERLKKLGIPVDNTKIKLIGVDLAIYELQKLAGDELG